MSTDFELFPGKNLSGLFKDIYDNQQNKKQRISELISEMKKAINQVKHQTKLADLAHMAPYSPTLRKALESGDVDTGMMRGIKIGKEIEKRALQIKRDNLAAIRSAKGAGN